MASTAVPTEPNAVIRMTAADGCSAFVDRRTSRPSLPPIFRSLSTTSNDPSCRHSMAMLPFGASSTSCPASMRARASARRSASWSSAISILPMHTPLEAQLTGDPDRQFTVNTVPWPAPDATSMRPSCASTIFRTMASPSPEPCGLVVKTG